MSKMSNSNREDSSSSNDVQRVSANKKPIFGHSLLFSNNSLLFYPLFYMKNEICFLYKGVSYSREPAVAQRKVTEEICWEWLWLLQTFYGCLWLFYTRFETFADYIFPRTLQILPALGRDVSLKTKFLSMVNCILSDIVFWQNFIWFWPVTAVF